MEEATGAPPPKSEKGIFETYLGRLDLLHQDMLDHPEKYEGSPTVALVESLVQRGFHNLPDVYAAVNPEEKRLLDQATLLWAAKAPEKPPEPVSTTPTLYNSSVVQQPSEPVPTPMELPEGAEPYWWL